MLYTISNSNEYLVNSFKVVFFYLYGVKQYTLLSPEVILSIPVKDPFFSFIFLGTLRFFLLLLSFLFFYFFLLVYGIITMFWIWFGFYSMNTAQQFSRFDLDEEIGSLDDLHSYFFLLLFLLFLFFLSFYIYCFTIVSFSIYCEIITYLLFLLFLFLGIPSNILWKSGASFMTFISGVVVYKYDFIQFIHDFLVSISLYSRFLVQNMRVIVLIVGFFELVSTLNYYYIGDLSVEVFFNLHNKCYSSFFISFQAFSFSFIELLLAYWEFSFLLVHELVVFLNQFIVFFLLIGWLFFFIYTALQTSKEKFFILKI